MRSSSELPALPRLRCHRACPHSQFKGFPFIPGALRWFVLPLHALRCFVLWDFCSLHWVSCGCCRVVFRFVTFTGCDLMFSWFGEKLIFSCRVVCSIWIKSSVSGVVDFQLALVMVHRLCDGFELIGAADKLCYLQWKSTQINAFDWGCAAIILCWLRCGTAVGTPDHAHLCSIPTWHTHYHTHLHSVTTCTLITTHACILVPSWHTDIFCIQME